MEIGHYTILTSLLNDGFLETDGETYWWVHDGRYDVIIKRIFSNFIQKKIVYPKRINDDTTCYYVTTESREIYSKKIKEGNLTNKMKRRVKEDSGKEEKKATTDTKINDIKNFLNI